MQPHPTEALERLVQLYDAWGKPDQAAEWRAKLAKEPTAKTNRPLYAAKDRLCEHQTNTR